MKIFELLAALGNCVLYWDPRSGSNRDWSENGNIVVPTAPTLLTRQGAQLRGTGRLDIAADPSLDFYLTGQCAIIGYYPYNYKFNPAGINFLWAGLTGTLGNNFNHSDARCYFQAGAVTSFNAVSTVGKRCLACSWIADDHPQFFYDGVQVAQGAQVAPNPTGGGIPVVIGTTASYIRQIPSTFGAVLAFNRALTAPEQALVCDALEQTVWPSVVSTRSYSMPKIDPNESGLVAGYNMRPVNGKIIDESPEGNDGDIVGPMYEASVLGDSIRSMESSNQRIDCGAGFQSLTNVTVSFWIRPGETSGARWAINYYGSTLDAWGFRLNSAASGLVDFQIFDDIDNANAALYGGSYSADIWHHVAIQLDALENKMYVDGELKGSGVLSSDNWAGLAGILYLHNRAGVFSSSPPCNLSSVKVRNYAAALDEIKAEYNAGANVVLYKTDWGARESITGLSNTDFQPISGAHKVVTVDYQGEPHKAIQVVTAGAIALPASLFKVGTKGAARGGFRWVHQKNSASGGSLFGVIMSDKLKVVVVGQNGYTMFTTTNRSIRFSKITNGTPNQLYNSSVPVIELGEFNEWGVDVTNDGEFSLLLNDELLPGGNPFSDTTFTESRWFVWDGAVGDILLLGNRLGQNGFIKTLGVPV